MHNKKNYSIRLAEEKDTQKIFEFINNYKITNDLLPNKIAYIDAKNKLENYSNLAVRFYLYNFQEEFILIENNNKLEHLISISLPRNNSKVFTLKLLLLKDNYSFDLLNKVFEFIIVELNNKSIIKPTKIRTFVNINDKLSTYWINMLIKLGFKYETIRECESKNNDLLISLTLNTVLKEEKIC